MTTKESPWPVEETVSRLKGVLESKGIKLFAVIDHSGAIMNSPVSRAVRNTNVGHASGLRIAFHADTRTPSRAGCAAA